MNIKNLFSDVNQNTATAVKNLSRIIIVLGFLLVSGYSYAQTNPNDSLPENASELPKVSPYYFQHQYLSEIVQGIEEKDGEFLITPYLLNTIIPEDNGFSSPFADSDISVDAFDVDGTKIYVWGFPESPYLREALYMAFVPIDGYYKAFAICIGSAVDWEVSTSTAKYRSTFGRIKKPASAIECLDLLIKRGMLTGEIVPGEFFQDGYTAPHYRE